MADLRSIEGGLANEGDFVCPWCAARFESRAGLDQHWLDHPRCRLNRGTNNPLQTKYGAADAVPATAGEETLRRIRGPECDHPVEYRMPLYMSDGRGGWTNEAIGWRCGWCYTEVPI